MFLAFLIEKTPKPEPPPSLTEHGSLTFLGSQEAPRCCPPNVFHQRTSTLIYSVVRKKLPAQQFTLLPHLLPPTAIAAPPRAPLFLLLFTDTAVLCQCVTSQCSSPEHAKTFPAANRAGMGEWLPYGVHTLAPCLLLPLPPFPRGRRLMGMMGRTRRRRINKRIGKLTFRVKFDMQLSSLVGAGRLPTAKPALPNLPFYHLRVDRKDCSSALFLSCLVIEEMVTGSRCWAALLPAATGLAWLRAKLPDTP